MTRDEVMVLSDDELRREVAALRGYDVDRAAECAPSGIHIPDYPRDIAVAWPLAEEIRRTVRFEGDPVTVVVRLYDDGSCRVAIARMSFDPREIIVTGDKVEPTLSRAYLIAKGVSE